MTPRLRPCTSYFLMIMYEIGGTNLFECLWQFYINSKCMIIKLFVSETPNYLRVKYTGEEESLIFVRFLFHFSRFLLKEKAMYVVDLQTVTLHDRSFYDFGLYEYNCFDFVCCRATRIMTFLSSLSPTRDFYILQIIIATLVSIGGNVSPNILPHYCTKVGRLG